MTLIDTLVGLLGPAHVLRDQAVAPYLVDYHGRYRGAALAVVRPGSADEVAAVVRACVRERVAVVPQGGNTGLMGGATPLASFGEAGSVANVENGSIVLSLARLNRILEVDLANDTITVEAGCLLQNVQDAAREAGRLFPLSLGSEGSCTIGGNLSTNAGGTQVIRYGNTRELTLGVDVVTAEGERWHGLRGLRKDNTGYALRDLYIGSEGTLGVITAATLKLFPLPAAQLTAFLAFPSLDAAVGFLSDARAGFGGTLTAFELMSRTSLALIDRYCPEVALPFATPLAEPWYALLEISDNESEVHARERFESVVGAALERNDVSDAVIAGSVEQSRALWELRDARLGEAQRHDGRNVKHDISVPVSRIPDFVQATDAALQKAVPGVRNITFGHLGDGNLHYNVAHGLDQSVESLFEHAALIERIVHDQAAEFGGSISAEHGIGQRKRDVLPRYKSSVELSLMRRIKQALDPENLMNPGKVLSPVHSEKSPL